MPPIQIRNFRNSDLEAVARLARLSFADPGLQEGGTPAAVIQRLRGLTSPSYTLANTIITLPYGNDCG